MEIAENITWTEELERLDVLLSQGQFELLLPGERYGGEEKEIWLVYLMNDAAESFLVFQIVIRHLIQHFLRPLLRRASG